jgi:dTDP-4-dehydrorhamnose reductase
MKILIFGSGGMLGHKLIQVLSPHADVWGTLRRGYGEFGRFGILDETRCIPHVDAADESSIRQAIDHPRPEVVINAIGVVKQLPTSKDVITTLTINSIFPHRLAQLAEEYGFRLITISTDCVFDGKKGNYSEADLPNAVDLYGKSKNLGEVDRGRSLTLRTSIIGRELSTAHSLVEWFLSNEGGSVKGFRQAIYSGFPTVVLANIIKDLIVEHPGLSGLYHVSSDPINKYDLLKLLKKYYKVNIKIEPSDDVRIDRSLDSTRFRTATGFSPSDWPEMVERMASDPTPYRQWK